MKKRWLVCTDCRSSFPFCYDGEMCDCGGTLLVQYDLDRLKKESSRDRWRNRPSTMWRYHELLPVPLNRMPRWERKLGLGRLWVKREEQNPTAVSRAGVFPWLPPWSGRRLRRIKYLFKTKTKKTP